MMDFKTKPFILALVNLSNCLNNYKPNEFK